MTANVEKLTVELYNVRFYAHHGVFEQEKIVGNEFKVDLRVSYFLSSDKLQDDSLEGKISYADLYEEIEREMEEPRKLLETVCSHILKNIFVKWETIREADIRLEKLNPPIPGMSGSAAVRLHKTR
ncbi:MAG: dihydroneopterin aldolase [Clostridium sp.]|nr:dihydroneopterin aldolase [Prevotella sp.]MCM1428683.1 dihydroneopterin aldolase [Clostridium sp.]MCM1475058.1 dihydroneopterin aldolase [Muribaculaceae bacterium]